MSKPLEDSPRTLHKRDEETLREAAAWVDSGHPQECWRRVEALASDRSCEYLTLSGVVLAHVMEQHTSEAMRLSDLPTEPDVLGSAEVGLDRAIESRTGELTELLVRHWGALARAPSGPWLVNMIAAKVTLEDFKRLWVRGWEDPSGGSIAVLRSLLWAANAQAGFAPERARFVEERLEQLVDLLGLGPAVRYVARARLAEQQRNGLLHRLLDDHGAAAARVLGDPTHQPMKPGPAMLRAYEVLKESDPYGPRTQAALVSALKVESNALRMDVAELVNHSGEEIDGSPFHMADELTYAIREAVNPSLMRAIGEDALRRDMRRRDILASRVHSLRIAPEIVLGWIRETTSRRDCLDYNAGLLRRYVSDDKIAGEARREMADLAETLFTKHGKVDRGRVLERWNVEQSSKIHKAAALMREVGAPPPPPDVEAILQNLQQYPRTLHALGGEAFAPWLRQNPNDFVVAHVYEQCLGDLEHGRAATARRGVDDVHATTWLRRGLEAMLSFRTSWERRFELLRQHGINFRQAALRTRPDPWIEAMIGARLLEGGFDVRYEPKDVLPEGPNLDFLVQEPKTEQEFFVEILRLGRRPDEALDKVRVGLGGEPKKSLQNKLRNQLRGGSLDLGRPLVLCLQVRSPLDLLYSVPNSLYGVLQVAWEMGDDGASTEAIQRNADDLKGLFYEEEFAIVSGVVAFTPERPGDAFLTGRMFCPVEEPRFPFPPQVYARLRDALFGRSHDTSAASE